MGGVKGNVDSADSCAMLLSTVLLSGLLVDSAVMVRGQSSNPVVLTVGEYRVVYMQDSTDLRWTADTAQQYCRDAFGTSLASFHDNDAFQAVLTEIDSQRGSPTSPIAYLFGGRCDEMRYPSYAGYTQIYHSAVLSNVDNTQWDFSLLRMQLSGMICPLKLSLLRERDRWMMSVSEEQTSAMICNGHNDRNWQSMNPARTSFIECDEQNNCILDCVGPPNCAYFEDTVTLTDRNNVTVRCGGADCLGMVLHMNRVGFVQFESVRGNTNNWHFYFGSTLVIQNSDEVYFDSGPNLERSMVRSLIYIQHSKKLRNDPAYYEFRWAMVIAVNVSEVLVDCSAFLQCRELLFEMVDVHNTSVIINQGEYSSWRLTRVLFADVVCYDNSPTNTACGQTDFQFHNGGAPDSYVKFHCSGGKGGACGNSVLNVTGYDNVVLDCGYLGCVSFRSLLFDAFPKMDSLLSHSHFIFNCDDESAPCLRNTMPIMLNYQQVEFNCFEPYSCNLRGRMGQNLMLTQPNSMNLQINCFAQHSCMDWWTAVDPFRLNFFASVSLKCAVTDACFTQGESSMAIGNGAENLTAIIMEEDSFGIELVRNHSDLIDGNDERVMSLVCEGFHTCADDRGTSLISNASLSGFSVRMECEGRMSCLESEYSVTNEQSSISLQCRGQESCSGSTVNGHCSESVSVEIESQVSEMTIICPSSTDECTVSVRSSLSQSSIGMTQRKWQKEKFAITGESDALVQVTSLHTSGNDGCLSVLKSDEVLCFLVFSGGGSWTESISCVSFVMSMYSPFTTLIGSLTVLFGVIFVLSAMNQTRKQDNGEVLLWPRNAMAFFLGLLSFTAVVCSLLLLAFQSRAQSEISSGEFPSIPPMFYLTASLNCALWIAFVSTVEVNSVMNSTTENHNKILDWLRSWIVDESGLVSGRSVWIRTTILVMTLRHIQMFVCYVLFSVDWTAAVGLCVSMDLVLMMLSRKLLVIIVLCVLIWLLSSQYSPIPMPIAEPTFFQVITQNTQDESSQILFDVFVFEMIFGVLSLSSVGKDFREMRKAWSMFIQFFDLATDLTVIGFWIANGIYLWAIMETIFVMSAALMQWIVVRNDLHHWKEHLMIASSMGRGYTKVRLWYTRDPRWVSIDKTASLLETFFESLPSMFFGIYLFLTDSLSNEGGARLSSELGPLLLSMLISGMAVATKIIQYTLTLPNSIRIPLFLLISTDFVVRSVPIAVCFAMMQSEVSNHFVSAGLAVGFPFLMAMLCSEQAGLIYYCSLSKQDWKSAALRIAVPSVLSASAVIFHSLRIRGIPLWFDFHRFLNCHLCVVLHSCVMLSLCMIIRPAIVALFSGLLCSFLVCLLINLLCTRILWDFRIQSDEPDPSIVCSD